MIFNWLLFSGQQPRDKVSLLLQYFKSFKKYTICTQDTIQTCFTGNKLKTKTQENQQLNCTYMTNKSLFNFESYSQILVKMANAKNILQSIHIFLK